MLAHVFRSQRKAMKLTQDELADELGISKRQIGRYEAGRTSIPTRTERALELLIKAKGARP